MKTRAIQICELVNQIAIEKEAIQPMLLDLTAFDSICSYMMILSFNSKAKAKAFAGLVLKEVKEHGFESHSIEIPKSSGWLLLDYGDLFIHIMEQEARDYYQLEEIWKKAKELEL